MKTNSLIISEEALLSVLREFSKEIQHNENEYMVSIWMKRKLENDHNKSYCIVFEARSDVEDKREYFTGSALEFKNILKKSIKEDTPIDFGLVEGTVLNHSNSAFAFQVKRFITKKTSNINQELLAFIHKILTSNKPGDVSLIVIPMIDSNELVPLDLEFVIKNIIVPKDSFKAIFMLLPILGYAAPTIKRIWPKS